MRKPKMSVLGFLFVTLILARLITQSPQEASVVYPDGFLSPDERWILTKEEEQGIFRGAAVYDTVTGTQTCVTCKYMQLYGYVDALQWTPDNKIAFVARNTLMIVDPVDPENAKDVAFSRGSVLYPTFSPTGDYYLWTSGADGMIYVANENAVQRFTSPDPNAMFCVGAYATSELMIPTYGSFIYLCANAPFPQETVVQWQLRRQSGIWSENRNDEVFAFISSSEILATCSGTLSDINFYNGPKMLDLGSTPDNQCAAFNLRLG